VSRAGLRAASAALLAVVAALLLGACGSSEESTSSDALTDEEYASQVQDVTSAFASGFDDLSAAAADPSSPEDFRAAVVAIQDRITETVDDLDAITPPEDLADEHEQLVQVFADYRDGYDPIVEALDADDQEALKDAAAQIPDVVSEFQTTYTEIKGRMADAGVTIEATDTGSSATDTGSSGSSSAGSGDSTDAAVPAY
jgi:major membrane immunogen (membrane-anchored lipoprotein)